jgi:hypothetical protein
MTSDQVRQSRSTCERVFAFLVDDFGYRRMRRRFQWGGYELGYCGPTVGVLIEWYPRDSLTVWLVVLVDGTFPPREKEAITPGGVLHYFDLGDVETVRGQFVELTQDQLYRVPDEEVIGIWANGLRRCAPDLLNGDLTLVPILEKRIKDRAREGFIRRFGQEEARQFGW